jgi:hypothetical protein
MTSGCIQDPESIAMTHPIVKDFLEEYPNAEVKMTHYSEQQASNIIDIIREDCGNPYLEAKNYYKVTIEDDESGLSVLSWIDWDNKIVTCATKFVTSGDSKGEEEVPPIEDIEPPTIEINNPKEGSILEGDSTKIEIETNEDTLCYLRLSISSSSTASFSLFTKEKPSGTDIVHLGGGGGGGAGYSCKKYYNGCDKWGQIQYCWLKFGYEYECKCLDPHTLCVANGAGSGGGFTNWKEMDQTGDTEHSHLQALNPGYSYTVEIKCIDDAGNEGLKTFEFSVKSEFSDYLIEEDIGKYKYLISLASEPDMDFSQDFIKGFMAIYNGRESSDTPKVSVWIFENSESLNDDIEDVIFDSLHPDKSHLKFWTGPGPDNEPDKIVTFDEGSYIWMSGNIIVKISDLTAYSTIANKYMEKYPPTFSPTIKCIDSDDGKDYEEGGYIRFLIGINGEYTTWQDACDIYFDVNKLREYYCEGGEWKVEEYDCPETCVQNKEIYGSDYCGGLSEAPTVTIEFPKDGGYYSASGMNVKAETDLKAICEMKLDSNETLVFDWTKIDDTHSTNHEYSIFDYLEEETYYTLVIRCYNSAGYGNTEDITFGLFRKT